MSRVVFRTLLKNVDIEEVDDGIFSCLDREERESDYDKKANAYDLVVGNALYNRILWGNWPSNYEAFCGQALASKPGGVFLDADCGSLVFTAGAYARAHQELIVFLDRSLGMLRKGRGRIEKLCGGVPKNMVFLQGDILELPFEDGAFSTVASLGMLHVFEEKMMLLAELERVKKRGGRLFFSSLVGNNAVGHKYLGFLIRAGEVADRHSNASLVRLLSASPRAYEVSTIGNMAYGKSA